MIKTIKQDDMESCMACCAAMIAGTTLEHARANMKKHPNGGYGMDDVNVYIMNYGFILGSVDFQNADESLYDFSSGRICFSLSLKDTPMLVTVKSSRLPGKYHAILWDGVKVHDPNPLVSDSELNDYEIVFISIISELEGVVA